MLNAFRFTQLAKGVALAVLCAAAPLLAQTPNLEPNVPDGTPVPTVTFNFELHGASPAHYSFSVDSSGQAAYLSEEEAQPGTTPGDPYVVRFTLSPATANEIFDTAKALDYFQGSFDYTKSRIANTGAKTLGYRYERVSHSTTYNYSENPQIQALTRLFQNLSRTLEFGRELAYLRRFDKLGLEDELKRMEEAAQKGDLSELQVDREILEHIANDTAVMHISRARAEKLIKMSANPQAAPAQAAGAPTQKSPQK